MVPLHARPSYSDRWFPRVGGDGPGEATVEELAAAVPPRRRGWSQTGVTVDDRLAGSPA